MGRSPATDRTGPVLVLADDLFVTARIDAASSATRREIHFIRSPEEFRAALRNGPPALILVGMAATRLPWDDLIREAKSDPAAAGVYVLAFGPHKDLALRARALAAGADRVIANSAFMTALPTLLGTPTAELADS